MALALALEEINGCTQSLLSSIIVVRLRTHQSRGQRHPFLALPCFLFFNIFFSHPVIFFSTLTNTLCPNLCSFVNFSGPYMCFCPTYWVPSFPSDTHTLSLFTVSVSNTSFFYPFRSDYACEYFSFGGAPHLPIT